MATPTEGDDAERASPRKYHGAGACATIWNILKMPSPARPQTGTSARRYSPNKCGAAFGLKPPTRRWVAKLYRDCRFQQPNSCRCRRRPTTLTLRHFEGPGGDRRIGKRIYYCGIYGCWQQQTARPHTPRQPYRHDATSRRKAHAAARCHAGKLVDEKQAPACKPAGAAVPSPSCHSYSMSLPLSSLVEWRYCRVSTWPDTR